MYINDLPFHISSAKLDLYADDTTVTSSATHNDAIKLQESLNIALTELWDWAVANKLPLNEKKTRALMITGKRLSTKLNYTPVLTVNGKQLSIVPNAKLLGLEIDKKLTFVAHVDNLCKKFSQRIGALRKVRAFFPLQQRILYYDSMIRPVMTYVSAIWACCDQESLGRALKLRKRAARIILNTPNQAPSVELFNRLKWLPFYEEAKLAKCFLVFKRLKGEVPSYITNLLMLNSDLHSRKTRYSNFNLVCPRFKYESDGGRSFGVSACPAVELLAIGAA